MKGMKVYLFKTGYTWEPIKEYEENRQAAPTDRVQEGGLPTLMRAASYCVLISHPTAGWILYDTGISRDPDNEWTDYICENVPFEKDESANVKEQLELLGLKPEDIKTVITSHMHFDHIGNDALFADTAVFYINEKEADYTYKKIIGSTDRPSHGWVIREDVLIERKEVRYINGDQELFEGIEIVELPGHTPGLMGLVIHLENDVLLFPSDACKFLADYNNPQEVPADFEELHLETMKKIKDIVNEKDAKIFFSHDDRLISTYKMIPEYYE